MGAGASTIPASKEDALAAGYTEEEINAYMEKAATVANTAAATAEEAATAALTGTSEAVSSSGEADTPDDWAVKKIQVTGRNKIARLDAQAKCADQRAVNTIGSKIGLEMPLDVQKKLHGPEFDSLCSIGFTESAPEGAMSASQLASAMTVVQTRLALEIPREIKEDEAKKALADFDLDHNGTLDAQEFTMLSKILITAIMINENPHDVAKFCLACHGIAAEDGGMPKKPMALAPIKRGKLPPLKGGLAPLGGPGPALAPI